LPMIIANLGLPMIFIEVPYLALALVPVAYVESLVYRARLKVPALEAYRGAMTANLWSTLLGVPIAWGVLLIAQISVGGDTKWGLDTPLLRLAAVTVQAPWLIPYEKEQYWMIPAASLFLMIPFFLASVATEWVALKVHWRKRERRLAGAVLLANLLSYLLLAGFWGTWLAIAHMAMSGTGPVYPGDASA
jgi:hypothetical protein